MFAQFFNKKILFVSGKGGTGKSVISALLALLAAQEGRRVLLAESQAFDKLAPLFGKAPIGHHETQIAENLSCINLDAKRCFAEYVTLHLGMQALYDRVFRTQAVTSLLDAIPGLDETMVLGRLFHTCELRTSNPYDLVIFDSPASGHFLNLLTTPDAILQSGLVGPLVREVERVRQFIKDPNKAAGIVVTLPESLVLTETFEFLSQFDKVLPLHLAAVILNRAYDFESSSFSPAIQKYFDRKKIASDAAQKDLQSFLKQNASLSQILYTFPDLGVLTEALTFETVRELIPFVKEWNFESQST